MRGRKATPTHLKLLHGNPGKRALNPAEPEPAGMLSAIQPPEWYDAEHRKVWRTAIDAAPIGLLKELDASIMNIWVCAYVKHQAALMQQALLDENNGLPLLTKTKKGDFVESPYLKIASRQAALMIKAASEMGFTPAARTRIQVEKTGKPQGPSRFFAGSRN